MPEFVEFIKEKYLFNINNKDYLFLNFTLEDIEVEKKRQKSIYDSLSKSYRDLLDLWIDLDICHFYEYTFDESTNVFSCQISKKVTSHKGDLWNDYELFLKDIIVPISSYIHKCSIESDDYGDQIEIYTDMQLRGHRLVLNDMLKSIEHIFEDGDIVATKIMYKRAIKPEQIIDLNRCFGR